MRPLFPLVLLPLMTSCVNLVEDASPVAAKRETTKEGAEQWASADDPSIFSSTLKYALADLPKDGEATMIPWASSYWPTYKDSINDKWDGVGSEAATTKYGRAFAVSGVEDAVSKFRGIDADSTRKACKQTSECKVDLGEECAMRAGKTDGRCLPTWFGICHAWAPASILVPEPRHAVTRNGVTFKVNDIKALITLAHDGVENRFVSLRCERDDRTGATNPVEFDDNGRPRDIACRDSNAGSFHVLVTNYLGIQRASFVFDQTYDDEVWNQPLRGFHVVDQHEVDVAEANRIIGVTGAGGTTSTLTANVAAGAFKHFAPVTVSAGTTFRAVMSGTGDGDLYVRFGAQPTSSTYDCRPYTDGSAETCELTVPAGQTQAFVSVNGYSAANVSVAVTAGAAAPSTYTFDSAAKKLVAVKIDVSYIGESSPEEDGPLGDVIDRYTSTNRYEYVLELDAAGKIIGGEWAGSSKRSHPDFAWLPVRVRNESVASGKIRYADVKALVDASVATDTGGGAQKTVHQAGTVARGDFKTFGPFPVLAGASLSALMTGTGDADLYVKKGTAPSLASYDCRPYKNGSEESCAIAGPGDVTVSVNGYATSSTFDLTITYTEGGGAPPAPPPAAAQHINASGTVALHAYAYFTEAVTAGKPIVVRTTAPHDVDVYLQMDADPTADTALAQAYTSSGNEIVRFVPSSSGVLHIGVHGYEASTFTVATADN